MATFLLILSIYSALGVTYLLARRARIFYYHWRYKKWLSEQDEVKDDEPREGEKGGEVVPNYARDIVDAETVEEREYREERNFLTLTGKVGKSWLEV